ncbi:retinaldehyde-binding protein 1 isoform X2 [Manduca sexta]|uniref:retinaldehyde-binding protein 1 isoform X2 n=1 Tax=Manduca sexta TaxID=7130 RepID=UPI0011839AB6|nr:retinaldehyde-binding protein 1 isoform X2 [Manduca sexta]
MDSINDILLKLHPDTVTTVRKLYNLEKREDLDRAIDALEDWLKMQHHFTKRDFPRDFLERSIIMMKGSVERAKYQISNLCSMRAMYPKFFDKYDAKNDFNKLDYFAFSAYLPKLTQDHYRVYVLHVTNDGITPDILLECFRFCILKCEYIKAHDYCTGTVTILDYRKINVPKFIAAIDIATFHQFLCILMEGYVLRLQGIHIVTSSKAIEAFVKIVKPIFGPKVSKRIHIHAKIETVYDYVPQNILPSDLGGSEESMAVLQGMNNGKMFLVRKKTLITCKR